MRIREVVESPEAMELIAAGFGRRAKPGDVICLSGPLGSGKTTFVQGFARGADFRGRTASPTFGLLREYPAKKIRIYHADLFRLEARELANLGIEEWFGDPKGVCLIEWPDVIAPLLPRDRLDIRMSHLRSGGRTAVFKSGGPRSLSLLSGADLPSKKRAGA